MAVSMGGFGDVCMLEQPPKKPRLEPKKNKQKGNYRLRILHHLENFHRHKTPRTFPSTPKEPFILSAPTPSAETFPQMGTVCRFEGGFTRARWDRLSNMVDLTCAF